MAEIKPARKTAPRKVKLTPPAEPKVAAPAKKTAAAKHWKPAPAGGRYYGGSSTPAPARNKSRKSASPDAKTQVTKTAAAKKSASSGVKKAAAAEVAGGGPEDPVADAVAAGSLLKGLKGGAKKATAKAPSAGTAFGKSNPRRWVLVEFLACFTVLGLGTIVAPSNRPNGGASHLAVKGSALALLFFILALMTGGGEKSKKAAEGLGALVTVAYLFTSQDAASLVTWISGYFDKSKATAAGASEAASIGAGIGNAGQAVATQIGEGIGNVGTVAGAAQ
jgi:hypothetical protein